jgi:hypothetical protein
MATNPSLSPAATVAVEVPGLFWKQRMSWLLTSVTPWLPWKFLVWRTEIHSFSSATPLTMSLEKRSAGLAVAMEEPMNAAWLQYSQWASAVAAISSSVVVTFMSPVLVDCRDLTGSSCYQWAEGLGMFKELPVAIMDIN